jgi:hypothetical protein
MPSCSSSSNIQGTSTVLNPTGSQSRISMKLLGGDSEENGYTLDSSIFAGGVVRYSPVDKTYYLSQADNNANSEVVGIVESKDATTGDLTVVLRGLIDYPTGATLNDIDGSGGSGGNDIWFLSSATAGQMQNLEPTNPGEIVKPVMQSVATSEGYDYQVLNYIGYAVGGEAVAQFNGTLPLGTSILVPEESSVPFGWVDGREERELPVAEYPDYYAYGGKVNGYVERITLDPETSVSSSLTRKGAVQKTSGSIINTGRITRVDTTNNKVDVRKSPTQAEVNTSNSIYLNNVQYTVSDSSVYSVFTPKITTNQSFNFYENGQLVQKNFKVIYKVKDDGGVTVPKKLNIEELTVTTKLSASNSTDSYDDVAEELTNIIARLEALENRVIGIS